MNKLNIAGQSVIRFADIEVLRYQIDGFEALPLKRKLLVYHLSQATLAGRDIIFDQNGRYNLRIRHILIMRVRVRQMSLSLSRSTCIGYGLLRAYITIMAVISLFRIFLSLI